MLVVYFSCIMNHIRYDLQSSSSGTKLRFHLHFTSVTKLYIIIIPDDAQRLLLANRFKSSEGLFYKMIMKRTRWYKLISMIFFIFCNGNVWLKRKCIMTHEKKKNHNSQNYILKINSYNANNFRKCHLKVMLDLFRNYTTKTMKFLKQNASINKVALIHNVIVQLN